MFNVVDTLITPEVLQSPFVNVDRHSTLQTEFLDALAHQFLDALTHQFPATVIHY
jgi:hypothetical protein